MEQGVPEIARKLHSTVERAEQAVLIGVDRRFGRGEDWNASDCLEELAHLARTAGATVLASLTQKLDAPSPTFYVGKGKIEELVGLRNDIHYDTAIFDDELSPRQQRNLEEALRVKVIDRSALILDVFAERARTREGRLQVELAQHEYLLPRLVGQWQHLERLGGGIGTRGPGESQLETDRRLIYRRISRLQQDIDRVRKHRRLYRTRRKKMAPPVVALVGYTNAGKSTLFNTLCGASVMAEDKLFSTLDPVTRRVLLPDARGFLLTDTVGFIHKLPHSIVAAFRATLEELEDADLLLNVVDIMHPHAANQCLTVENVLRELQLGGKPRITVFNKLDLARPCGSEAEALAAVEALRERIAVRDREVAMVSALKGWGIPGLLAKIDTYLSSAHRYGGGCDENNDSV